MTKRKGPQPGNTNANYYRALNTKSKANLPTLYKAGDNVTANRIDNANSGGLVIVPPDPTMIHTLGPCTYTGLQ